MPDAKQPNHLVSGFHSRGVLPHLKREGSIYFVTFRQAGTLPKEVLLRFKVERNAILAQANAAKRPLTWHEQDELFRWYSSRVDKYLDAGHGTCYLRDPAVAEIVAGAIQFFEGQRYELRAWVVMPHHVHVVVWPMPGHSLSDILHSWKSFTAHEINKRLAEKVVPFWQSESYDHWVRDDEDLHRCCHYTTMNPVNAGLCARPEDWRWGSAYAARSSTVTQPSPAAGSSTVPVRDVATGGGTPPEPAGEEAGDT
jgi:REP element-mobilizing transposase RayT